MPAVCFYFQVHQPYRLRKYSIFDSGDDFFADERNRDICRRVAKKAYLPANKLLLDLIEENKGRFRVAFSLTGVVLEQFERYAPEVLASFQALAETGCVEFLAETYHHSLSFLYSRSEFVEQVELHREKTHALFGQEPTVFRNTELVYGNDLAFHAEQMGFRGVLCEGADEVLNGRTPNMLYRPPGCERSVLFAKNYRLTDDIAFRFSNKAWPEWPLSAEKFAGWLAGPRGQGDVVNLFMDYETVGEHQWAETGIFDFFRQLPAAVLAHPGFSFRTPSEIIDHCEPVGELDVSNMSSWADTERDLSAWLGNAMQSNAMHELYRLESAIKACEKPKLLATWRRLQSSDHFYYMCVKYFSDGDVHKYFNPYESPYDSYINFMNVLDRLKELVGAEASAKLTPTAV